MVVQYNNRYRKIEEVYTYNEWLREYRRREASRKARKRKIYFYFFVQKIMGLITIYIGLMIPFINRDGTPSLLILPLGMYLVFVDKIIII